MKRTTLLYTLICSLTFVFAGCANDEDEIFSSSSMERLNEEMRNSREKLINAENGWVLEYFPDSSSEGFTLFLKFSDTDEVEVATRNYLTEPVLAGEVYRHTSVFEIIADYGPVLTFNTYNDVMHLFSDPENQQLGALGLGLGGDYEFRIMDNSDENRIILEGKKRKVKLTLFKCPTNITWNEYAAEIYEIDNLLFTNSDQTLSLETEANNYIVKCLEPNSAQIQRDQRIFTFTKENPGLEDTPLYVPYIVTRTGLKLIAPTTIDGHIVHEFELNSERTALVSLEDPAIILAGPNLGYYFYNSTKYWAISPDAMSSELSVVYNNFVEYFKTSYPKYTAVAVEVGIQQTNEVHQLVVKLIKSSRESLTARFNFETQMVGRDQMSFIFTGAETSTGTHMYESSADLSQFINMISGTIDIESENPINPSGLNFIKSENPNIQFFVTTQ